MKKTEGSPHICICLGSSCYSRGNAELLKKLREVPALIEEKRLTGSLCMGSCSAGPNVSVDGVQYEDVSDETMKEILDRGAGK